MFALERTILVCMLAQAPGILVQKEAQSPGATLQRLQSAKASQACSVEDGSQGGFAPPVNGLSKQLRSASSPERLGRLFIIGDDVAGDICERGRPGLCCSAARPCEGASVLKDLSGRATWEVVHERGSRGWTSLREFGVRSRSESAVTGTSAYVLDAALPTNASQVMEPIALIQGFLHEAHANSHDVMIVGLLGRQSTRSLSVYDAFTIGLIKHVVNKFTGRTVLLSASPTHPAAGSSAAYSRCLPNELPGDKDPPINSFQNAIFVYNVWAELANPRARLVDTHDMLLSLGQCHRDAECRAWSDAVVTLTAQLALNALEKIQ